MFFKVVVFCDCTELKCIYIYIYELNVLYVIDSETCFALSLVLKKELFLTLLFIAESQFIDG